MNPGTRPRFRYSLFAIRYYTSPSFFAMNLIKSTTRHE